MLHVRLQQWLTIVTCAIHSVGWQASDKLPGVFGRTDFLFWPCA